LFKFFSRLPVLEKFIRFWRIFRAYIGDRLLIYIVISVVVTLLESVGIGLFFPLMNGLQNNGGPSSTIELWVDRFLRTVGLTYNLQNILASLVVVFLVKAAVQMAAADYQSRVVAEYLRAVDTKIYSAICEQRYQSFLGRSIGTLSNAVVNETNRATVALSKFAALFPSIITIFIFSGLALRVDWRLTIGVLGAGLVLLLGLRLLARYIRGISRENTESFGRLNELVLQSFNSFKYLRATMGVPVMEKQVNATIDKLSRSQYLLSATANFSQIINEPIAVILLCGMFWQQTVLSHQPLSHVVVLALVFYRLIKEVMSFQGSWNGFAATSGSIDLVTSIIAESERGKENISGELFSGIRDSIRFDNVSFSYGNREVVSNCSLKIPRNAMVALVGESGSGKSTLVDLMTGILRPTAGKVFLDDVPLERIGLGSYRARIGYVTQEPALFSDTIKNNISLWDEADPGAVQKKVEAAASDANCIGFISVLPQGYDTALGDRGVNLSGGQRQRIAIAREIYRAPDLLVLDEATSALDSETEVEIQKSIEALKGKITTVVIAHRLSTIRNADWICVLSQGRLVEEGTFETLFSRAGSHFQAFCNLQGLR
jgi:ABC-type multidrug transport system fused ATPase/permease subunit